MSAQDSFSRLKWSRHFSGEKWALFNYYLTARTWFFHVAMWNADSEPLAGALKIQVSNGQLIDAQVEQWTLEPYCRDGNSRVWVGLFEAEAHII